jgi:hypothetical protein
LGDVKNVRGFAFFQKTKHGSLYYVIFENGVWSTERRLKLRRKQARAKGEPKPQTTSTKP